MKACMSVSGLVCYKVCMGDLYERQSDIRMSDVNMTHACRLKSRRRGPASLASCSSRRCYRPAILEKKKPST
jgi:hypothetical protein